MDWPTAMVCGAIGGCLIEAIVFYGRVSEWRTARHEARARARRRKRLPSLREHVDLPADSLVALTRLALGGIAGGLFHSQVIGMMAAVAVGASAPALLQQLGATRQVQEALQEPGAAESAPQRPQPHPIGDGLVLGVAPAPGEVPAE
ncbi:hypothetical protein [Streptomyces sp. NBC_00658]|uniref:hypothetical protein n=1 Tax=Streptomyces sp. NBC_00658 TaxID=2975800 RepID=UPI0032444835